MIKANNKSVFFNIVIVIYLFILIYTPPLLNIVGINVSKYFIVIFTTSIINIYYFVFRTNSLIKLILNRNNFNFIFGVVISSCYIAIVAFFNGYETRIIQNIFLVYQFMSIIIVVDLLKRKGYKHEDLIKLIFNVVLLQGIICILMLILPNLREIAFKLYYNGGERNIWIDQTRVYGISSDYTYSTPIFHGIIACVMLLYSIEFDWKYIFYIPFVLLSIMLNGRTGILIFLVGAGIISLIYLLKTRKIKKIIVFIVSIIILILFGTALIKYFSENTYNWIIKAVNEVLSFIVDGEKNGTIAAIYSALYFPKGASFWIGEGHRVYGQVGFLHSDIGLVNDMFLGGIIYIAILYTTIYRYCLSKININLNNKVCHINKAFSITIIPILIIANYKGECMREGIILTGLFFIKVIIIDKINEVKIDNIAQNKTETLCVKE